MDLVQIGDGTAVLTDPVYPQATLNIPAIGFGDINPQATTSLGRAILGEWDPDAVSLRLGEIATCRLRDAIVHPPGIVTVGDRIIKETLIHVHLEQMGYSRNGDTVGLPDPGYGVRLPEALHLLGGNSSNHFHWLLDILPRLQVSPFIDPPFRGPILLPRAQTSVQRDILELLSSRPNPLFLVGLHDTVRVASLLLTPNLVGYGFTPNPFLRTFYDHLLSCLGVDEGPVRRIYVSREDSVNRPLVNEDAVVKLVTQYGFETVELAGRPLREQALMFRTASHIIAPHGGGLANIVFCREGTALCELQMDQYIRWFFRRLAGVRNMRYGCVIGHAEAGADPAMWPHTKSWTAPVERLKAVLDDPRFWTGKDGGGMVGMPSLPTASTDPRPPRSAPCNPRIPPEMDDANNPHLRAARHRFKLRSMADDLPGTDFVFLCFTNRCGSNYVAASLASDGRLNVGHEFFNDDMIADAPPDEETLASYVSGLARREGKGGRLVTKLAVPHVKLLADFGLLAHMLPRSRFIMIERSDVLGQAISFSIAWQNRRWDSGLQPTIPDSELVFSSPMIDGIICEIVKQNAAFQQFFAINNITAFTISYEQFTASPDFFLSELSTWLDVDPPLRHVPSAIALERQSGAVNSDWRQRFMGTERTVQAKTGEE